MKKKVIVNSIFLCFLIAGCAIHIFCLMPQRYSMAVIPIVLFYPFVFIAFHVYCSKNYLFLTKDDIAECPKSKLLDRGITVFHAMFLCLTTAWIITRRR